LKVLKEEATMQGVGAVLDEVVGRQMVGAQYADVRKFGIGGLLMDLENEGGVEGGVAIDGLTEEKTFGLHGVLGQQKTTDGGGDEEVGAFEEGWSGMAAFGGTVADEEAGDVALDEALVEIGEQMGEA
jgi:hypothetical protein